MIRRQIGRDALAEAPYLAWNSFINLIAMEAYEDLEPVQRVAHLAFWYDSEVQNGGHLQYFVNQGVGLLQPTVEALTTLGAHGQRKVFERAAAMWRSEPRQPIDSVEEFVDVALEGEFNNCDEMYHGCAPSIMELLELHLERHRDQFLEVV